MAAKLKKNFFSNQTALYLKFKGNTANTVDPDEMASDEPSHLDLQCLQIHMMLCLVF